MKVNFVLGDGREVSIEAPAGRSFMEIARDAGLPVEGTCGGQMSCCTCHMILDKADYQRLGRPSEEEIGMLDLADGLTATSRLGCQISLNEETDGMTVRLPR
jgi:ferredoxin